MDRHLARALETTQMIVPEIDLGLTEKDGLVQLNPVAFTDWHYYLHAIESAHELLDTELSALPDVESVEEIRIIASDLGSLILSLKVFYVATLERFKVEEPDVKDKFERFSKYRKQIDERQDEK